MLKGCPESHDSASMDVLARVRVQMLKGCPESHDSASMDVLARVRALMLKGCPVSHFGRITAQMLKGCPNSHVPAKAQQTMKASSTSCDSAAALLKATPQLKASSASYESTSQSEGSVVGPGSSDALVGTTTPRAALQGSTASCGSVEILATPARTTRAGNLDVLDGELVVIGQLFALLDSATIKSRSQ